MTWYRGHVPPRPMPAPAAPAFGDRAHRSPHPSRALPLCTHCRHAVHDTSDSVPLVLCNHPAAPVIPINGRPAVSATYMRSAQWVHGSQEPVCGEAGQWFEPQADVAGPIDRTVGGAAE